MATETQPQYQHLEARPGSNYRQLWLKGRRIRAAVVYEVVHGPDPRTPEEFAEEYQVPLEAVREAIAYVTRNMPLIEQEREREAARIHAREIREAGEATALDAVDQEGDREKWPLWDGLSDEQGPIPAFGPGRTDENGRVRMSDEERVARRDAAIRALAAVGDITDETDTDEVWTEVFRGLEETS